MNREFGTTAWGGDWVRAAEPTTVARPDPTLPRARSLARNDRVGELELGPGRVAAVVSDRTERRVGIVLPTWDPAQVATARAVLAGHAVGADLPDAVHAALVGAGLPLAPHLGTATCTCARAGGRCVHALATCYEVARRLDERPRLALALRGLPAPGDLPATARLPLSVLDPADFYGPSAGTEPGEQRPSDP